MLHRQPIRFKNTFFRLGNQLRLTNDPLICVMSSLEAHRGMGSFPCLFRCLSEGKKRLMLNQPNWIYVGGSKRWTVSDGRPRKEGSGLNSNNDTNKKAGDSHWLHPSNSRVLESLTIVLPASAFQLACCSYCGLAILQGAAQEYAAFPLFVRQPGLDGDT